MLTVIRVEVGARGYGRLMRSFEVESCLMHQAEKPGLCRGRIEAGGVVSICLEGWTQADEEERLASIEEVLPGGDLAPVRAEDLGMMPLPLG